MTKSMNYSVGDKVRIKATKQVGTIIGLHDYHILYNVDVGTHCKWLGEIEIEKVDASAELIKGYLDLIRRQQAEIETAKQTTVKEFAEKLKMCAESSRDYSQWVFSINESQLDNLVNEMFGNPEHL